jgi:D-tyrosyl-tRNA(Tyr) deacylase
MRAVVQRVLKASVTVENQVVGAIDRGLLVLIGLKVDDTSKDMQYILNKLLGLRIFEDAQGKMNVSVKDIEGKLLIVPNFTLYGDATKGMRPSFIAAGDPKESRLRYEAFIALLKQQNFPFETGVFQADMKVELVNDGPVTILLDSEKRF